MPIRICVAGATGWAGKSLVARILSSAEFSLSGAIARKAAGQDAGIAIGGAPVGLRIAASLDEALAQPADVLVDYTRPDSVKQRVLAALSRGLRVVIGTSGLSAQDYGRNGSSYENALAFRAQFGCNRIPRAIRWGRSEDGTYSRI